jgi:hypothetical protein
MVPPATRMPGPGAARGIRLNGRYFVTVRVFLAEVKRANGLAPA